MPDSVKMLSGIVYWEEKYISLKKIISFYGI